MDTRYMSIKIPQEIEYELVEIKLFQNQSLIHIIQDSLLLAAIEPVEWVNLSSKTIRIDPANQLKIKAESKELKLTQSKYMAFAINGYYLHIKPKFIELLENLPVMIATLSQTYQELGDINESLSKSYNGSAWLESAREKIEKQAKYLLKWKAQLDEFKQ